MNCTDSGQDQRLTTAFYLLHKEGFHTKTISQLFLQIKLIMTFSILNQYFKGLLFYRTVHQYFIYFNNLSFITEPDGACSTLVLKKSEQGGEGAQNPCHLGLNTYFFFLSCPSAWEAELWVTAISTEGTSADSYAKCLLLSFCIYL